MLPGITISNQLSAVRLGFASIKHGIAKEREGHTLNKLIPLRPMLEMFLQAVCCALAGEFGSCCLEGSTVPHLVFQNAWHVGLIFKA
jgi:hypothetical protein